MKRAALRLPGTHRVKKNLSGGRVAFYWYRSRGGPLLMKFEGATLAEALRAEADGAHALIAAYALRPDVTPRRVLTVGDIVTKFRASPEGFLSLAPNTQSRWAIWLDRIVDHFGDLPAKGLEEDGARIEVKAWRDERKHQPRSADYGIQVLQRVLAFALDNEWIRTNPAAGIKRLYKGDRSNIVVEDAELALILGATTRRGSYALRLAAATGMRREDLTRLQWDHVREDRIHFDTGKSRGRIHIIVPLHGDGAAVIDELRAEREKMLEEGRVPPAYVLWSDTGRPWSPDSVTQLFARAAKAVGIMGKTLNDLRGTAATRFVSSGMSDVMVAEIVGWSPSKVERIRKRYVSGANVAQAAIAHLEAMRKTG